MSITDRVHDYFIVAAPRMPPFARWAVANTYNRHWTFVHREPEVLL